MIGIMDWGIGGLSVYKALRQSGLTTNVTYLSDSGSTPYGKMSRADLRNRLSSIGNFFKSRQIQSVFVACNAASSALDLDIEEFSGITFYSIIPAGVAAVASALKDSGIENVGIIGGDLTIQSLIYQKKLANVNGQFKYLSAQPLSAFVEAGYLSGPEVDRHVKEILRELGKIDALLLACTHYPALIPLFKRINPSIKLLDPAGFMVENIRQQEKHSTETSQFYFFTTGDLDKSQKSAKAAFEVETKHGSKIEIADKI